MLRSIARPTLLLAAVLAGSPLLADEITPEEVKRLALEAILENPEIVMEAVALLQRQEEIAQAESARSAIASEADALLADAPVLGDPAGDVAVIEFFDYNCPYCRRAKPILSELMSDDPGVRVVGREWPILGEGSVFAARAALAARAQDLYEPFHWALMGMAGRAERGSVLRIAEEVGLDVERLLTDMEAPEIDAHIAESMRLADLLGFSGTPSFVVGETLLPGLVDAETLAAAVARVREAR
ncbi:DsbA family protein [Jannaschia sp. M317]|uniref:DsbA family protein n=1 Tax=Jannaschia sp. M317 TaxID=2867011 RepID=UPI0021A4EDD5|nr:DsbA family protein [Jannaschia sp. M317]UWQ19770.1 DsbA family protein [Jannaschia sp. M317]